PPGHERGQTPGRLRRPGALRLRGVARARALEGAVRRLGRAGTLGEKKRAPRYGTPCAGAHFRRQDLVPAWIHPRAGGGAHPSPPVYAARSATPGSPELSEDFASESSDLSEGQLWGPIPGWRSLEWRPIRSTSVSGFEGMTIAIDSTSRIRNAGRLCTPART